MRRIWIAGVLAAWMLGSGARAQGLVGTWVESMQRGTVVFRPDGTLQSSMEGTGRYVLQGNVLTQLMDSGLSRVWQLQLWGDTLQAYNPMEGTLTFHRAMGGQGPGYGTGFPGGYGPGPGAGFPGGYGQPLPGGAPPAGAYSGLGAFPGNTGYPGVAPVPAPGPVPPAGSRSPAPAPARSGTGRRAPPAAATIPADAGLYRSEDGAVAFELPPGWSAGLDQSEGWTLSFETPPQKGDPTMVAMMRRALDPEDRGAPATQVAPRLMDLFQQDFPHLKRGAIHGATSDGGQAYAHAEYAGVNPQTKKAVKVWLAAAMGGAHGYLFFVLGTPGKGFEPRREQAKRLVASLVVR